MKRLKYLAVVACAALAAGCEHMFDEYNSDPNNTEMWQIHPESMMEQLLFSAADELMYGTWQLNGELMQYTVNLQSENIHRYIIRDSYANTPWNYLSKWAANADHMRRLAILKEEPNCQAIALTMRALMVSNQTDLFGSIPFSEAYKGRDTVAITQPRYDTQQEVYTRLLQDLELANSLYDVKKPLQTPTKDLIYGGDVSKWRKFTNSLHLRLLMRLSNRDQEMNVTQRIQKIVNDPTTYPVFTSNADNAILTFTNISPNVNRFGKYTEKNFSSNTRVMAEYIIRLMDGLGDPRLVIYARQQNNEWKGLPSGYPTTETINDGSATLNKEVLGDYTSPSTYMRYDEVLFILAEATYRGMLRGGEIEAQKYYEQAILASIDFWDSVNPSSVRVTQAQKDQYIQKTTYNNTLEQIMTQKYIAQFWCGYEAWADYRRTGYPVLIIGTATDNNGILPTRLMYPSRAQQTNSVHYEEAVREMGGDNMRIPVWWSQKATSK